MFHKELTDEQLTRAVEFYRRYYLFIHKGTLYFMIVRVLFGRGQNYSIIKPQDDATL